MKQQKLNAYFEERIAFCRASAAALAADDRGDEAVFDKVRLNVYDIFRTIFSAGLKAAGEDEEKAAAFFLEKLRQIPGNWRSAQEAAENHGLVEKAHIERIKLDTAAEIEETFRRIWEEAK